MWARSCTLLLAWAASLGSCVPRGNDEPLRRIPREQPVFGITHLDIRDSILGLGRTIKSVASKLNRHEAREAQLGASTTATLDALTAHHQDTSMGVQAVARQLAKTEERLLSIEALIQTTDERQRMMLGQITQGLDRLLAQQPALETLPPLPPLPDAPGGGGAVDLAVLKVVKKLNRKVSGVELLLQRDMRAVSNEVKIVGQSLGEHMNQLKGRHDRLQNQLGTGHELTQTTLHQLSETLTASTAAIQEQVQSVGGGCGDSEDDGEVSGSCLEALTHHSRQQEETLTSLKEETQQSLDEHLATLQTVLLETYAGQNLLNASVDHLTKSLGQATIHTQDSLGKMTSEVLEAVKEDVNNTVTSLERKLHDDNVIIMDMLDDRASQAENLQNTVLENYSDLSAEITSLKKVEQVMIHTADSVLDTKRSIEFGIQQIILELGEIVKSSGSIINSTLSDQINNISFNILRNQTSALTNMTAKMEQEISQVWRQIGIMYQQMSQSADILDQLRTPPRST
ncbi:hypothetical protein GWK47_026747 [Chionoecetes opilio]|uniref:Uncharacterized protein n=1 Tax=Chionoecetes opilio TaxID=41210 RepID=A0A8J8WA20_CHIOP|nr:hypothetical protein GWK47_026747 [Chionoecetes opilio]